MPDNDHLYHITFQSLATAATVDFFPVILNQYNDVYNIATNADPVFGRADPIYTYQNTSRLITVGFTWTPGKDSDKLAEAQKMKDLIKMSYPSYKNRTLQSPPLVHINIYTFFNGVAYLENVNFELLDPSGGSNILEVSANKDALLPKKYKLSLSIKPIHDEVLGHDEQGAWIGGGDFPFK
jgi:hypothetical protein